MLLFQRLALALASGVFGGNTNVSAKFLTIAATQLFKGDFSVLWRLGLLGSFIMFFYFIKYNTFPLCPSLMYLAICLSPFLCLSSCV